MKIPAPQTPGGRSDFAWAVVKLLILNAAGAATLFLAVRWAVNAMDPMSEAEKASQKRANMLLAHSRERGRLKGREPLTKHETIVAADAVLPEDISDTLEDVGGLQEAKGALRDSILLPLRRPDLFGAATVRGLPKGVLLYGPPGTGKTMLARALARECRATFISVRQSTLMDKWFGESQKLCRAVWDLAAKLSPTIIFIDEIDSFLRDRGAGDTEGTLQMKSEFMMLWDGMLTGQGCAIVVVGATNRPMALDQAILRRLPRAIHVPMPDEEARGDILRRILRSEPLASDVSVEELAALTEGCSGSDLRELCKEAAMGPARELVVHVAAEAEGAGTTDCPQFGPVRPVCMADLLRAASLIAPSNGRSLCAVRGALPADQRTTTHEEAGDGWGVDQEDPGGPD